MYKYIQLFLDSLVLQLFFDSSVFLSPPLKNVFYLFVSLLSGKSITGKHLINHVV